MFAYVIEIATTHPLSYRRTPRANAKLIRCKADIADRVAQSVGQVHHVSSKSASLEGESSKSSRLHSKLEDGYATTYRTTVLCRVP